MPEVACGKAAIRQGRLLVSYDGALASHDPEWIARHTVETHLVDHVVCPSEQRLGDVIPSAPAVFRSRF